MNFSKLKTGIINCKYCKNLGLIPNPIFWGNKCAKIVHISQAPSLNVHKTSKPFNDASGKKLREQWYKISEEIFYNKNNFYITAVAHCFPGKATKAGDKKAPIICAKKWLNRELAVIDNKIYIILGRQAASFLFPEGDYNDLIFKDNKLNKKPAFVLPHPSPLNIRWFKSHPEWKSKRLPYIRRTIKSTLELV